MTAVVVFGTCDTKLEELVFLKNAIRERNRDGTTRLVDVGWRDCEHEEIDFSRSDLIKDYGKGADTSEMPRAELISFMAQCAAGLLEELYKEQPLHGVVAAGGSGGTVLASKAFRSALPIGFPKLIVSTVASGDTSVLVGESDVTLMYSVVDVAGMNRLLAGILTNAAGSISGMAAAYKARNETLPQTEPNPKKRVGITMFGVTTPAVNAIKKHLDSSQQIETYIFHATGHGGKSMERLITEGQLDAVIDLTTTEVCDLVTGGIMAAAPERFDAAVQAEIPTIISLGALDMSNFGPKADIPEKYRERNLHEHNSLTTLMRTSEEESAEIGRFIAKKLRGTKTPEKTQIWIPLGGVSMLSTPGGVFEDRHADQILFNTIKEELRNSEIKTVEDQRDINDPGFAKDIANALISLLQLN
ncbi:unnamed protein product [Clonostachys rosea f. rosea IK726]|uniref:Uncharacterized protein n=2 Tax=Bionectria ochroleuca TaxID=29856 RepID=A0A0B7KJP7_BIOOC|nr:unnamed protein product [Clonostachys rosea f. rosea IK726]